MKFQIHRYISTFTLVFVCLFSLPCSLVQAQSQEAVQSNESASVPTTTAVIHKNSTDPTSNPYGLEALWASSDLVTKVVLLLLVIMSMGSWYIMIVKVLEQSKMGRQGKDAQAFWSAKTVAEGT